MLSTDFPATVLIGGRHLMACAPTFFAFSRNSAGMSSPVTIRSFSSGLDTAAMLAMAYKNSPLNQKHLVSQFLRNPSMASWTMYSGIFAQSLK